MARAVRIALHPTHFTRPTWRNALVLIAGAVLAPGRRTVSAALRAAGRDQAPGFARYHRVLNGGRWSGLAVARSLLVLLVRAFAPAGPVVVGLDDTLERRWGRRIKARGIYRWNAMRSIGALVARPLRQGQRPALALDHAARTDPVGGPVESAALDRRSRF